MMSIHADGRVGLCCCDPTGKVFADYYDEGATLYEIWHGSKYSMIRKRFAELNPKHKFCGFCLKNVSENIKPLLTIYKKDLVKKIIIETGSDINVDWL